MTENDNGDNDESIDIKLTKYTKIAKHINIKKLIIIGSTNTYISLIFNQACHRPNLVFKANKRNIYKKI